MAYAYGQGSPANMNFQQGGYDSSAAPPGKTLW